MKKLVFIFALIVTSVVHAQAPEKMNYQAIVRDADGNLLSNTTVGIQISILENNASGTEVYVETHSVNTNINGLLTLEIGTGSVVSGNFTTIDWSSNSYFVKSETDPSGGTDYTISGTSQLSSVPYALYAKTSGATYKVGDFAKGGVVFWVDDTGKHGLVVTKFDLTSSIRWFAGSFGNTYGRGDGLYAGKSNTNIIIGAHGSVGDDNALYAARLVNEYQATESGITYGDWYLPSNYELNLLYLNRKTIDTTAVDNGGEILSSSLYWSSTEVSNTSANVVNLSTGDVDSAIKNASNYVRAIRSF